MSDDNVYYFAHDDVIPSYRQLVKREFLLPEPGRNSAPSRLEHLGEFQAENLKSSAAETNLKSTSLTNLFSRQPHSYDVTYDAHSLPNDFFRNLTGSMQFKANESGRASPLNPILNGTFLPRTCHDPNNNNDDALDDSDTVSQSSSTSLEPSDDHCCFANKPDCQKGERSDGFDYPNWRRLIRHDTFNLEVLSLDKKESDYVTDDVTCHGMIAPMTSLVAREKKEDAESISSLSSDDTFICEDILEEKPAAVYRSYSDSTVHRSNRKEKTELVKRRKSVHFADASGYELEIHIPISQSDEYKVPPRLMEALGKIRAESKRRSQSALPQGNEAFPKPQPYSLVLNFQQPFLEPTFQSRISHQHVCLESVSLLPNSLSFTGVIRVENIEFEKQVIARCSFNNWRTFSDIPAHYVSSLLEFQQDQFSFHVIAPESVTTSGKLELAICFKLPKSKREFWDNNYGRNYVIKCLDFRDFHDNQLLMT